MTMHSGGNDQPIFPAQAISENDERHEEDEVLVRVSELLQQSPG